MVGSHNFSSPLGPVLDLTLMIESQTLPSSFATVPLQMLILSLA